MSIWTCWYILRQDPEIKPCGKQMLMTKSRVLTNMIWCDNVDLLYLIVWWNLGWFLLRIKQGKFLNGHITYQSHMSILMFKPSTYACLWPIEFCQIVVTLGRIFHASMIEITYTHIYKLTPTPGVTQNMASIHQK
jgi:hypothetical protein